LHEKAMCNLRAMLGLGSENLRQFTDDGKYLNTQYEMRVNTLFLI